MRTLLKKLFTHQKNKEIYLYNGKLLEYKKLKTEFVIHSDKDMETLLGFKFVDDVIVETNPLQEKVECLKKICEDNEVVFRGEITQKTVEIDNLKDQVKNLEEKNKKKPVIIYLNEKKVPVNIDKKIVDLETQI